MRLLMRLLVVVALLAVPLGLAVTSQALADRPGPPAVPTTPVVIEEAGPPPAEPTADSAAPSATPPPGAPQVVEQVPIPVDDGDENPDEDPDEVLEDPDD